MKLTAKQKGILFLILSAFFFTLMNFFAKLSGDLPSMQKAFFRNIIASIGAIIVLVKSGVGFKFTKRNLPIFILRSFFGTLGIVCNFYAIEHLFLAEASILGKLAPFFVIIFSFIFLKEKIKPYQAIAVLIAFLASFLIIKPSFAADTHIFAALVAAAGGMTSGVAYTAIRYLSLKGEKRAFIIFFFSCFSSLMLLPFVIYYYQNMNFWQIICLLCTGLAGTGGQFSITAAYSYAPARSISVFDYTQIVFASLFGFIAFGEILDKWSAIGICIIFGVALFMFLYNKKSPSDA